MSGNHTSNNDQRGLDQSANDTVQPNVLNTGQFSSFGQLASNNILNTIKLTTFSGRGFESWKQQMLRYLFLIGLKKFVDGEIINSASSNDHVFLDQTTSSIIDSYISEDVKLLVKLDVSTAHQKWTALNEWYATQHLTEIDESFVQVKTLELVDGNLNDYITKFLHVVNVWEKNECTLDRLLCNFFLHGLGDDGKLVRMQLKDQKLSIRELINKVNQLYEKTPLVYSSINHVKLHVNNTGKSKPKSKSYNSKQIDKSRDSNSDKPRLIKASKSKKRFKDLPGDICHHCNERGHKRPNCPKLNLHNTVNMITTNDKCDHAITLNDFFLCLFTQLNVFLFV